MDLAGVLERLHLPRAEDKACTVGSSAAVVTGLVEVLGPLAGTAAKSVRKLGYDYSGGRGARRGGRQTMRARYAHARRKLRRINLLRRKGRGQSKLVYAGARPTAEYGAEVGGAPPDLLHRFAAGCSTAAGFGGPGADHNLAWALGRPDGVFSPEVAVTIAPAVRYAKEWWMASSPDPGAALGP